MAQVFLSYDRDDEARARPLAAFLERAGHSVWWDRNIKGGGEFGAEIEAALESADKVVVLWSKQAVRSAWVRDEAAAGRDTGRLVPTTLDGTAAPLGFRQYQTIDLSRWKGRGSSPQIAELLEALGTVREATRPPPRPTTGTEPRSWLRGKVLLGGAVVVAVVVAGLLIWRFAQAGTGEASTPTFAITAADASTESRQLAADIATRISGLDDPSGADFHIVESNDGSLHKGFILAIKAGSGGRSGALTLTSSRAGPIVWSAPIDVQKDPEDVVQAGTMAAQRALSCTADVLSYRRERINQDTLKLYVNGCTQHDAAKGTNGSNAPLIKIFRTVVDSAPHFSPAWSKLLELESEEIVRPEDDRAAKEVARADLDRAERLGIDVPEAYAVRANLISPGDFLGIFRILDEGIRKHPDSATLFRIRGDRQPFVGRMNDAVEDAGHAVELNPLSPANQQSFASNLAYAGNSAGAFAQLRKAERLWPNSPTLRSARYRIELRFGDPREAQRLYFENAVLLGQNPAQEKFIEARINPTPQNVNTALEAVRSMNRQFPPFIADLIQSLGYFGRKDEAIDLLVNYPDGKWAEWIGYNAEVLFRPMMRDVWRDPRSMAGAAHVGLLHYWKTSGNWPDFCFDPTLPYDCKKEAAKYPA